MIEIDFYENLVYNASGALRRFRSTFRSFFPNVGKTFESREKRPLQSAYYVDSTSNL